jgi:hypothetical protein
VRKREGGVWVKDAPEGEFVKKRLMMKGRNGDASLDEDG